MWKLVNIIHLYVILLSGVFMMRFVRRYERCVFTSLLISASVFCYSEAIPQMDKGDGKIYGSTIPEKGEVTSLNLAIDQMNSSQSELQKLSGTVNKVCRRRGCWMILSDGGRHARVTFKGYQFFVPTDTHNQGSVVYGVLSEKMLSEELAQHYADDEGQSGSDITGSVKEHLIEAEGVYLENAK